MDAPELKVTLVKKLLANGQFCAKCIDVQQKLEDSGYLALIDEVVIADETDPESKGMKLAEDLNVNYAPFFIVEQEGRSPMVYTVYFKLVKEVLNLKSGANQEIASIVGTATDDDFC